VIRDAVSRAFAKLKTFAGLASWVPLAPPTPTVSLLAAIWAFVQLCRSVRAAVLARNVTVQTSANLTAASRTSV